MSIYSANRTGYFDVAQVAANESYTHNDFGRILCESQANDMAFFEAALASDFKEINSLREGTLLEAEVPKLNKESAKAMLDKVVEMLKQFWAKIQGALDSAIKKLAEATDSGKVFVKKFESKVSKEALAGWKGSVEMTVFDLENKAFDATNVKMDEFKDQAATIPTAEIVAKAMGKLVNGATDVGGYAKLALAAATKADRVLSASNMEANKAAIAGARDHIKALKAVKANAQKSVAEAIKSAKTEAKEADTATKKGATTDVINALHAYQQVVTAVTRAAVIATKQDMRNRRVAMVKAMNDILKADKALGEAAAVNAAEEFDDVMNAGVPVDDETKTAIEDLVKSVDDTAPDAE